MPTLNPLSEVTTFQQFLPIVKKAESKLSWFGNRYVSIGNENETLELNQLTYHMIALLMRNRDFSLWERPAVKEISKLINRLYQLSDEQVKNSNIFTILACMFREIFGIIIRSSCRNCFSDFDIRDSWSTCALREKIPFCKLYKFYTPKQFKWRFWYTPDKSNKNLDFYCNESLIWYRPRKDLSKPRRVWNWGIDYGDHTATYSSTLRFSESKKK